MKHWFSGNLYPLSIQIPTKRSGPQYGVPDVPEGRRPAWKGRYRHAHAAEDVWLPLLQEDQRCGHPDGNFRSQQRSHHQTLYLDQGR